MVLIPEGLTPQEIEVSAVQAFQFTGTSGKITNGSIPHFCKKYAKAGVFDNMGDELAPAINCPN